MESDQIIQNNSLTINIIVNLLESLPGNAQCEVLDFVEFLKVRQMQREFNPTEDKFWSEFSLSSAMNGIDEEESLYTSEDIIEPCND